MEASSQDEAFSFASAFCHSEVDFKRVRKNYDFARVEPLSLPRGGFRWIVAKSCPGTLCTTTNTVI